MQDALALDNLGATVEGPFQLASGLVRVKDSGSVAERLLEDLYSVVVSLVTSQSAFPT